MIHRRHTGSVKPKFLAALAAIAAPTLLWAQVSLYQWSESNSPYVEITEADGGVSLGTPVFWPHVFGDRAWVNNPFFDPGGQVTSGGYFNPAEGPGYPIGFDFTFNGDVFDRIGISNGGWISFGKSTDGLFAVWVYNLGGTPVADPLYQAFNNPSPAYRRNRVAGFGNSYLQQVDWSSLAPPGPKSSLRVATIGTAPNRVCVVQWKDYGLRNDVTVSMNQINFQIRLYEADNSVEVHFGYMDWVSTLGRYTRTQIGLGGQLNEDYNGRMTVYEQPSFIYDWTSTVPMDTTDAACIIAVPQPGMPNGSGVMPLEGTVWRWEMPACPPPAWPQTISDISFDAASASWQPSPAGQYEYVLTTENNPDGNVVSTDITTDESVSFFGLEPTTQYYFFIRSICGGEPGPWAMATSFVTMGGGMVNCDGTIIDVNYCSHQHDTITWLYQSGDGSTLRIEFQNGFISTNTGDSFKIWHNTAGSGPADWTMPTGNPAGLAHESTSGVMFIQLVTEQGSCETQEWFLPFQWRIGCKNCQDPLASYGTVEDCANDEYSVAVDLFSLGSSSSVVINNSLGVPPATVTSTGVHTVGPFPAGETVVITIQNPDNAMCHASSTDIINTPCLEEVCGPSTFTQCYGYDEFHQWGYTCACDNQQVGVRFISGTVGLGNHGYWYDAADPADAFAQQLGSGGFWGDMTNQLVVSNNPDHAVVLEVQSEQDQSCTDPEGLYGASTPWYYVVACYDGCTQPQATFSTACISTTQYEVVVNITTIGSTGNAQITNTGGAATVAATAAGTYTVGPFNAGTPVTVEVEGASILCTWTSPALVKQDCSDYNIGINENNMGTLQLFPNPNTGRFTMQLPSDFRGTANLRVMDLAGRIVARQELNGTGMTVVQLPELPNGLYALALESNRKVLNGTIIIQR